MIGRSLCRAHDYDGFVVLTDIEMLNNQYDLQLSYVSNDGTIDAERFIQTFGYTGQEEGRKVRRTADGGYVILANSHEGTDQKIMLIKTDDQGVVE